VVCVDDGWAIMMLCLLPLGCSPDNAAAGGGGGLELRQAAPAPPESARWTRGQWSKFNQTPLVPESSEGGLGVVDGGVQSVLPFVGVRRERSAFVARQGSEEKPASRSLVQCSIVRFFGPKA